MNQRSVIVSVHNHFQIINITHTQVILRSGHNLFKVNGSEIKGTYCRSSYFTWTSDRVKGSEHYHYGKKYRSSFETVYCYFFSSSNLSINI